MRRAWLFQSHHNLLSHYDLLLLYFLLESACLMHTLNNFLPVTQRFAHCLRRYGTSIAWFLRTGLDLLCRISLFSISVSMRAKLLILQEFKTVIPWGRSRWKIKLGLGYRLSAVKGMVFVRTFGKSVNRRHGLTLLKVDLLRLLPQLLCVNRQPKVCLVVRSLVNLGFWKINLCP